MWIKLCFLKNQPDLIFCHSRMSLAGIHQYQEWIPASAGMTDLRSTLFEIISFKGNYSAHG
jgi:hypothetical protein